MGSGSVTPGKVRGSGGLAVAGAVLVISGVTAGLVGEALQQQNVATWRLLILAGGIMVAAGLVSGAALLVMLIAARSRGGADLGDAESDWGLDTAEEWLGPLRTGRRRPAQAGSPVEGPGAEGLPPDGRFVGRLPPEGSFVGRLPGGSSVGDEPPEGSLVGRLPPDGPSVRRLPPGREWPERRYQDRSAAQHGQPDWTPTGQRWPEYPSPERPPRLAPVQYRPYPSDDPSHWDAGRAATGARLPADPAAPRGPVTQYPGPPSGPQRSYQPAHAARGPAISPQRRGPAAPQRDNRVSPDRPPQPISPGQGHRQPPYPLEASPYPPGPVSEPYAVGPGSRARPGPESGALPGARPGPESGPGTLAGPGTWAGPVAGLHPESGAGPRSWFEAIPRPPGSTAPPPDIRTGPRPSRNGDPAGFAIVPQPAPMPAPPSRPVPPANPSAGYPDRPQAGRRPQAGYPARASAGHDTQRLPSPRPDRWPERPSPAPPEPSRREPAGPPPAMPGQDALDDTCPLPVILPGRGTAARQESRPERPPEPPRMPASRTAIDPARPDLARPDLARPDLARPAAPAAESADVPAANSRPRAVAGSQALPDAEAAARAARAKLDQLKELYLTAEAIGEDALVRHFDEVSQRQRDLIREYFKQPGRRPSTILRDASKHPPQDGPAHQAESANRPG